NNYRVNYVAKLRLFDSARKTIVAEALCVRIPEYSADAPSHAQLLANRAAVLKAHLRRSADACVGEFAQRALGLSSFVADSSRPGSAVPPQAGSQGSIAAVSSTSTDVASIERPQGDIAAPSATSTPASAPVVGATTPGPSSQWIDGWNRRRRAAGAVVPPAAEAAAR
ncbi:hypothetical protein, partial [Xanthomonas maliensis]